MQSGNVFGSQVSNVHFTAQKCASTNAYHRAFKRQYVSGAKNMVICKRYEMKMVLLFQDCRTSWLTIGTSTLTSREKCSANFALSCQKCEPLSYHFAVTLQLAKVIVVSTQYFFQGFLRVSANYISSVRWKVFGNLSPPACVSDGGPSKDVTRIRVSQPSILHVANMVSLSITMLITYQSLTPYQE